MAKVNGTFSKTMEGMRLCIQEDRGIPVVLRKQGETYVKCPYCLKKHNHAMNPGHHKAGCSDGDRFSVGITIGDRYFVPNYGYTIVEYEEKDGVNTLIPGH